MLLQVVAEVAECPDGAPEGSDLFALVEPVAALPEESIDEFSILEKKILAEDARLAKESERFAKEQERIAKENARVAEQKRLHDSTEESRASYCTGLQ